MSEKDIKKQMSATLNLVESYLVDRNVDEGYGKGRFEVLPIIRMSLNPDGPELMLIALRVAEEFLVEQGIEFRGNVGRLEVLPEIRRVIKLAEGEIVLGGD